MIGGKNGKKMPQQRFILPSCLNLKYNIWRGKVTITAFSRRNSTASDEGTYEFINYFSLKLGQIDKL